VIPGSRAPSVEGDALTDGGEQGGSHFRRAHRMGGCKPRFAHAQKHSRARGSRAACLGLLAQKAPRTLPDTHLIAQENVRSARAAKMRGECPLLLPPHARHTPAVRARGWSLGFRQRERDAVREDSHCPVHVRRFMRAVCNAPACSCPDPGSGACPAKSMRLRDPFSSQCRLRLVSIAFPLEQ
jgi:hypothetical protein